jgi:ABC-type sugar transport system ATPase subunit
MIALEGVSLERGSFTLRRVDLSVGDGEYLFLVGPSGAGKTLLLEVIAGLHPDVAGRVLFGGRDVTALPPEDRNVALVYQDYALFPHLTVRENVAFGPSMKGLAASPRWRTGTPAPSPAGSGSGSLSPGRWPRSRRYSSSTSPSPRWTRSSVPGSCRR